MKNGHIIYSLLEITLLLFSSSAECGHNAHGKWIVNDVARGHCSYRPVSICVFPNAIPKAVNLPYATLKSLIESFFRSRREKYLLSDDCAT